ncbi:MAG: RNA polymerase sigma factor [Myxococcota bacterium]
MSRAKARALPLPFAGSERVELDDLEGLYANHVNAVSRAVARLRGPAPDIEDLVHEVFLRADAERARFRGESTVLTWLIGIAYNLVRARRRQEALRRWLLGARQAELMPPPAADALATLEAADALAEVHATLDALPERYRAVLILHELEDLRGPEIAAILGIAPATVWVRLHRAREHFRRAHQARRRR